MIEGGLHRLLALFQYDWQSLAEQLRQSAAEQGATEQQHIPRRKGQVKRLPSRPNGDASELLLNRMAEGGPQLLSSLYAYLAESRADTSRAYASMGPRKIRGTRSVQCLALRQV